MISQGSRGQALVEFALVLPLFVVMLFGLIDVGRLVYMNSTLSQAAREGARLAAVEAYWVGKSGGACGATGGPVCRSNDNQLHVDVRDAANRMMSPFGTIGSGSVWISCDKPSDPAPSGNWTTTSCADRESGDLVSVRVAAPFQPLTPVASSLFGPVTLSASATMVIN